MENRDRSPLDEFVEAQHDPADPGSLSLLAKVIQLFPSCFNIAAIARAKQKNIPYSEAISEIEPSYPED